MGDVKMEKRTISSEQYFLEGYRRCIREERFIEADIAERRANALSPKSPLRDSREFQKGAIRENHSMASVDAYLDMEAEKLREAREKTEAKRDEIMAVLNAMEDKLFARLLVYRYICEFPPSWEEIAHVMGGSVSTVKRWHEGGLIEIMGKIRESTES
jgi:DNA-directed RNA polymerase specialized sigma24 family protein